MDDLDRFLAFERRILAGMSTRVEPFEHGTAYFDDDVRDRFISNFLLIDPHQPQLSAETLLADAERILGGGGYRHRLLVVVDEAGMVGTHHWRALLTHTTTAGVKTVMVGDPHQLAPVKARGGMFTQLCEELPWAQRLSEVWRMHDPGERSASLALIR